MTDSQAHRSDTVAAKPEIRNRTDPVFLPASKRKKDLSLSVQEKVTCQTIIIRVVSCEVRNCVGVIKANLPAEGRETFISVGY